MFCPQRSLGDYAFSDHNKVQGKFIVPKRVRTIGAGSFQGLGLVSSSLTIEFQDPSQLTDIRKYAFEKARTDVLKLPESLETIGIAAFMDLIGLNATSSFTIPGNVKRIGRLAFTSFDTSFHRLRAR